MQEQGGCNLETGDEEGRFHRDKPCRQPEWHVRGPGVARMLLQAWAFRFSWGVEMPWGFGGRLPNLVNVVKMGLLPG